MKVVEKPIKKIVIYEVREFKLHQIKSIHSGTAIEWCDGYFIDFKYIDEPSLFTKKLTKKQEIHIAILNFCKSKDFPKTLQNCWGDDIRVIDASISPIYKEIAKFLKERDQSKGSGDKN